MINSYDDESGVKEIHYLLYGKETVVPGDLAKFNVSKQGVHYLSYWAVDNCGNEEVPHILLHFPLYIDNIPPQIQITKPDNALYINNKRIFPFPIPLIFGDIEIEVYATDDYKMSLVSFHINDELKNITYSEPYSWMWDETTFGKQTIKVVAFDYARNRAIKEITVWKFF